MTVRFPIATVVLAAACVLFSLSIATSADLSPADSELFQKLAEAARKREAIFEGRVIEEQVITTKSQDITSRTENHRLTAGTHSLSESVTHWETAERAWKTRTASLDDGSKFVSFKDDGAGKLEGLVHASSERSRWDRLQRSNITSLEVGRGGFLVSKLVSDPDAFLDAFRKDPAGMAHRGYKSFSGGLRLVNAGTEVVGGRECVKVEMRLSFSSIGEMKMVVFFDPTLGYAPVAMTKRVTYTRKLDDPDPNNAKYFLREDTTVEWSDFREFPGGVFLPMRVQSTEKQAYKTGQNEDRSNETIVEQVYERLEFPDSIPEESFKLNLPKGTHVHDKIAKIEYEVEDGRDVEIAALEAEVEETLEPAAEPPTETVVVDAAPADDENAEPAGEPKGFPAGLIALVVVVLAIAAALALRARRARGR